MDSQGVQNRCQLTLDSKVARNIKQYEVPLSTSKINIALEAT